jgi:hypothetical protein
MKDGRNERIRTSGPCFPKAVLYRAELHSDACLFIKQRLRRKQLPLATQFRYVLSGLYVVAIGIKAVIFPCFNLGLKRRHFGTDAFNGRATEWQA